MSHRIAFLPGWGMSPRCFDPLIGALGSSVDPRVLKLPDEGETTTNWVQDLLPQIAGQVLCGWSLGALLALFLARSSIALTGLVLIAGTPKFVSSENWPHGVTMEDFARFATGIDTDAPATMRQFIALQSLGEPAARRLGRELARHLADATPRRLRVGLELLREIDLREQIASITPPALLIHGAADRVTPLAACHWLRDHLPHATACVLSDTGHAPHLSQTAACAQVIQDFLHRLP